MRWLFSATLHSPRRSVGVSGADDLLIEAEARELVVYLVPGVVDGRIGVRPLRSHVSTEGLDRGGRNRVD